MLRFLKLCAVAALLISILGSTSGAYAGDECYSPYEAEAEQGIRIHSELMVIGLNCMHLTPPGHQNFYVTYKQFTAKNQDLFEDYEGALINHFRKSGAAKPEGALNDLRTNFANRISKDAASMRPDIFCARYVDRLNKVSAMDRARFRKWAATIYPSHPVSRPVCQ